MLIIFDCFFPFSIFCSMLFIPFTGIAVRNGGLSCMSGMLNKYFIPFALVAVSLFLFLSFFRFFNFSYSIFFPFFPFFPVFFFKNNKGYLVFASSYSGAAGTEEGVAGIEGEGRVVVAFVLVVFVVLNLFFLYLLPSQNLV
jgi:hypothetical protein